MAWRIHENISHGEIDNRTRGRVTGRIWLAGVAEPIMLDLRGDCAPDLAGCRFTFENPNPIPMTGPMPDLAQRGWVGDITASQKLRIHDVPPEEVLRLYKLRQPAPWHWANTVYLEWHSTVNGGITIQTAEFRLTVSTPVWTLTPEEYQASREASGREMMEWSKAQFGLTDEDFAAVEDGSDGFDEDEGEEWKRADDDAIEAVDPMLVFDPIEDAEWLPARGILIKYGFTPLRPAEVSEEHLCGRLWELIYALAGRRIFLNSTDHLSDRALYEWLDTFLEIDCADCPLDAEMNNRDDPISLSEKPAHHRDDFLPEPPQPMKPPPAIEEALLEQVRDIERDGWQRPMDELVKRDIAPIPPDEMTDAALPPHLWELLHNLACRGFYVLHTDHLSDRALYEVLWKKGLREEAILPGRSRTGGYFYDTIGSYGDEDLEIFHRYYETEKARARRLAEFPNPTPPPRETPPFSRDWRLPKGPF